MKYLILFSILSMSSFASTKKAIKSFKEKKYYTSSAYIKKELISGKINLNSSKVMIKLLPEVGIYPFLTLKFKILKKLKNHSNINYLIGKKHLFLKQEKEAITYFNQVKSNSPFYLSSLLHLASLYEISGNLKKARGFAKKCMKSSKKVSVMTPVFDSEISVKTKDYIHDLCEIIIPRSYYKDGKMKKAKKIFEKIPLNSYQFPDVLFNSSWAYFRMDKLNRAIGKNITFQAPLLNEYFYPESDLVKVLSYLKLCQYDDAINTIQSFHKNIRDEIESFMKQFGLKNKDDEKSFIKILLDKDLKKKLKNNFIYKMFRVLRRSIGIKTLNSYFVRLKAERKLIKTKQEFEQYKKAKKDFIKFYNTFVKVKLVKYSKEIIKLSNIMAEIEVDTYTFMKEKYYEQKTLREGEESKYNKDFNINNSIAREKNQFLWNFHGEFWADELGAYIPKIKNACQGDKK